VTSENSYFFFFSSLPLPPPSPSSSSSSPSSSFSSSSFYSSCFFFSFLLLLLLTDSGMLNDVRPVVLEQLSLFPEASSNLSRLKHKPSTAPCRCLCCRAGGEEMGRRRGGGGEEGRRVCIPVSRCPVFVFSQITFTWEKVSPTNVK